MFGVGSYTYQYNTRDTFGFAMKSTYGEIDGKGVNIYKKPKTDKGIKNSAKGLLHVDNDNKLTECVTWDKEETSCLETVFKNGKIVKDQSLEEIRSNLKKRSKNFMETCLKSY